MTYSDIFKVQVALTGNLIPTKAVNPTFQKQFVEQQLYTSQNIFSSLSAIQIYKEEKNKREQPFVVLLSNQKLHHPRLPASTSLVGTPSSSVTPRPVPPTAPMEWAWSKHNRGFGSKGIEEIRLPKDRSACVHSFIYRLLSIHLSIHCFIDSFSYLSI